MVRDGNLPLGTEPKGLVGLDCLASRFLAGSINVIDNLLCDVFIKTPMQTIKGETTAIAAYFTDR